MHTGFQQHPDGLIYVRKNNEVYCDTLINFEADFHRNLPSLPENAFERIYEPNKRHAISGSEGVIEGGDIPWAYGDDAVDSFELIVAAKAARLSSIP